MKIRAIRVAECGRFREPVAVEGLSGGLDVLVGPNEAGKSTLLRAMRLALKEKHTSNQSKLRDLVSYGASAPLIELDFEADGVLWRLRKRYLNQRMAELRALGGTDVARGADAETRLVGLLGEGGDALLDMLWLEQGAMLAKKPEPDENGRELLASLLAREIEVASGGDGVRRLRLRVQERLDGHVTRAREQKRGRFAALEQQAKETAEALAAARRQQGEIEALTDRLGGLAVSAAVLADPAAVEARHARAATAVAALVAARTMLAERDAAKTALAEARGVHEATAAAAKRLRDGLTERDRLAAEDAASAGVMQGLGSALDAAERARLAAVQAQAATKAEGETLALQLRQARAHEIAAERQQRLATAAAAAARAAELAAEVAAAPLVPGAVAEAQRLSAAIGEHAARLEAQSAVISIAYEPGQAGRIRIAGTPVDDGARIATDTPLVLDIPGIGRITVSPGHSADRERLTQGLAEDRERLRQVLAASGAADAADLVAREAAGRAIRSRLAQAEAEAKALAPEGLQRLEAMAAEARQALVAAGGDGAAPPLRGSAQIEAELERQRPVLAHVMDAMQAATAEHSRLAREEAAHAATAAERSRRLAEVASALPPAAEIASHMTRLDAEATAASRAYDEASRAQQAATNRTPDAAGFAGLEAELATAQEAVRKAEQQLAAIDAERARISGQIEGAGHEDIAAKVDTLAVEAERAAADFADLAEEVDALRLLDRELGAAADAVKSRFIAPVAARVQPYLDELLPDAGLALGETFGATGLSRAGRTEELVRLSDGTREQIAVIVRLGLARLMAERGLACPLVLDDALVYSDDGRVGVMHRSLATAAALHQVIVLTCREQAFAGLGGTRLQIVPWKPD